MFPSQQVQAIPKSQQVFDGSDCGHTIDVAACAPSQPFLLPRPVLGTCRCGSSSGDKGDGVSVLTQRFRATQVSGQSFPYIASNHSGEQTRNRLENPIRHSGLPFAPRIKYISKDDNAIAVQFHIYGVKEYARASWDQEAHTLCIKGKVQLPKPGEFGDKVVYAEGMFGEFERSVSLYKYLGTNVVDCKNSKTVLNEDGILVILPKINREKARAAVDTFEIKFYDDLRRQ